MTSRSSLDPVVRGAALAAAVVLDAVAFATVLRPRHGYTSAHRLLVVLAFGVGVAVAASIIAGAIVAVAHRRRGSLWKATTTLSTLGIVFALFITAAVGSRIVLAARSNESQFAASTPAARAEFERWQATVVPIVVRWTDAMRTDKRFIHGLPPTALRHTALHKLQRSIRRAQRTLQALTRSLVADKPRLPQRPALRRLTSELTNALMLAQRAQSIYSLSLEAALDRSTARKRRASRFQALIERGNTEAERALAIMYRFSLDANKFGGGLFAQKN